MRNRNYQFHLNRYQRNGIIPFPFKSKFIIPFPSKKLRRKYRSFRDISLSRAILFTQGLIPPNKCFLCPEGLFRCVLICTTYDIILLFLWYCTALHYILLKYQAGVNLSLNTYIKRHCTISQDYVYIYT